MDLDEDLLVGQFFHSRSPQSRPRSDEVDNLLEQLRRSEFSQRVGARILGARRGAVINPVVLGQFGLDMSFLLLSGRTGHFDRILASEDIAGENLRHFVLYGEWDALIQATGTGATIDAVVDQFDTSAFEPPIRLDVRRTLLVEGYTPAPLIQQLEGGQLDRTLREHLNALVQDYDLPDRVEARDYFSASGIILGPAWSELDVGGVTAFVGLQFRGGRSSISDDAVLDAVLEAPGAESSVRDCYALASPVPFQYLVRARTPTLKELDTLTDGLSLARVGGAVVKGTTLIVASLHGTPPQLLTDRENRFRITLESSDLIRASDRIVGLLANDERTMFAQLPGDLQLRLLSCLSQLQVELESITAPGIPVDHFATAVAGLSRSFLLNPLAPNLTGPVASLTATVEPLARSAFEAAVRSVYGRDMGRAQSDLKLSTRKFSQLSLGKIATALRVASGLNEFDRLIALLDDETLDRLVQFTSGRNAFAHGATGNDGRLLEAATDVMIEGMRLSVWLASVERSAGLAVKGSERPDGRTEDRRYDFFISHASEDRDEVARPLAALLSELGYEVWIDEGELTLGDSLREKIDMGLARSRYGVVILSRHFFSKRWPSVELNALFARQVVGEKVILPVWHAMTAEEVAEHSPLLVDRLAARTDEGLEAVARRIVAAHARR